MEEVLRFENKAYKGIRLVAKKGKYIVTVVMHCTAVEGDFYVEIEDSEKGTFEYFIFRNFYEVIKSVEQLFGQTNLKEFLEEAHKRQIEIYKDKYVRKYKGVKNKEDIYKRLEHIPKKVIDKILFS